MAQATLREIGTYLGEACAILIKLFNPQAIIISGKAAIFKNHLMESIDQVIQQRVIIEMLTDFTVQFADYTANHEAVGAGLIALDHFLNQRMASIAGGSE